MNQHIKTVLNLIQKSEQLSEADKMLALESMKQLEEELLATEKDHHVETALEKVRNEAMAMRNRMKNSCKEQRRN